MSADKLVRMANQIADFFRSQPQDTAVAGAADHMKSFWNPVMRRQIYAHLDAGGAGLDALALEALKLMRSGDSEAVKTKS
ncbi:MAG: formate dehydrogenase subunit delta [Hyphomicrobiales bacterium]|nr:formate dehydrogenase subunit delta [Hyphomicrobiales bacterium]